MNRQVKETRCNFEPDNGGASQSAIFKLFDVNEFNPVFGPLESIPLSEVKRRS